MRRQALHDNGIQVNRDKLQEISKEGYNYDGGWCQPPGLLCYWSIDFIFFFNQRIYIEAHTQHPRASRPLL